MASTTSHPSRLHWLPCSISHDGPAPVDEYFKPKKTGTTSGDLVIEEATLRGRSLLGATYPLPEGYAAYVLPKDQKHSVYERETAQETASTSEAEASEEEDLIGLGAPTCWKAAAAAAAASFASSPSSSALTYWKLDEHPTPQDGQRRALDWVGTARAVAARVSGEEVDREMMMMKE